MQAQNFKLFGILVAIACMAATSGFGQTTKQIAVRVAYDDNTFRNYMQEADYTTHMSFYLSRDFMSKKWEHRLFYAGDLSLHKEYSERFSHYHKIGYAAAASPFGKGDVFSLGGNVSLNRRRSEYDYANYAQVLAYGNYKFRPGKGFTTQFGYRMKYRDYENLPELSHFEHQLFGRFSTSLPSRTSLILYGRFGLKDYQSLTTATVATDTVAMGRGHRETTERTRIIYSEAQQPSASQLITSLKIAQSLTAGTGLSMEYLRRINLGDEARFYYADGQFADFSSEEDIFDDPYSYEGYEIYTTITQILPRQVILKLGYDYLRKDYDVEALDLAGQPLATAALRQDTRKLLWLNMKKRVSQSLQFILDFYYLNNNSNDPYFDYNNSFFSIGTEVSF